MNRPPPRLLESAELSFVERRMLDAARSVPPVHYDMARGAARLRTALELGGPPAPSPLERAATHATSRLSGGTPWIKLAGIVVSVAGLNVAAHYLAQSRAPARAPAVSRVAPAVHEPAPELRSPIVVPARPSEVMEPTAAGAPATNPSGQRPSRGRAPLSSRGEARQQTGPRRERAASRAEAAENLTPSETSAQPSLIEAVQPPEMPAIAASAPGKVAAMDELREVARARRLVNRDPRAALELLDQLARAHPRGYFLEERAALTVLALTASGQRDLARLRATKFIQQYPQSPFADRVRAAVMR